MLRVAVTTMIFNLLPYLRQELLAKYPEAKFNDDEAMMTEDWLIDFLKGYDIAVIGSGPGGYMAAGVVVKMASTGTVSRSRPSPSRSRG